MPIDDALAQALDLAVVFGDATSAVQQLAGATLPSTISTSFQGTAQAFQDSLQGLGLILIMAIVVIALISAGLYQFGGRASSAANIQTIGLRS